VKVEDVMTRNVVSVGPGRPLKEVAANLASYRISGMPVVDEGTLVGVVSEADIVRKEAGEEKRSTLSRLLGRRSRSKVGAQTAGEAMSSPPITISPRRDVSEAARLMVERDVNRLPVLEDGMVIGIVTRADLVRAFVRSDVEIARELRDDVIKGTLWIDPEEVTISVERGVVTLAGELDTKADAELVERFSSRVPGVVQVRSQLRWRIDEPKLPRGNPRVPVPSRTL
jgi:CBS domain-containing protein